ncbi:MAG: DUF115 domain-containing protein [Candidatus Auribacter fodinae]|uniref:DUF115 domain-containing protein n=1 Tax=Candidatus Auribacter fodinae TaxID=2093366 RepID=A0A3A4R916_9BACT|nr:MAG: DUF115 domain-containing protein [Candidatus Auribacter fodinae]
MDPVKRFQDNLEFIRAVCPYVERHICQTQINLLPTRSGSYTFRYKDVLLHSMMNPEREAQRFADSIQLKDNHVVIYGFGLGYHLFEIAQRIGSDGILVVIELNPEILTAGLSVVNLEHFASLCRFSLITGVTEKEVLERFHDISRELENLQWSYVIHQASYKCLPPQFRNIHSFFESMQMERRTSSKFRNQFLLNFEKNLETVVRSPGIDDLKCAFHGKPVVIVGAGPSLDETLPLLREFEGAVYIISVDTALQILLTNNICPDFIVSVDPQPITLRHFRLVPPRPVPLLFCPVSNAETIAQYPGPFMVFLQKGHSVTGEYEELLTGKGVVHAGGSVSCIAVDIAVQFGFTQIFFAGMDYAYPQSRAYSAYSYESRQLYTYSHRFKSMEILHRKRIAREKQVMVPSYNRTPVLSAISLNSYRKNIEKLVEIYSQKVTFYTLSETGASVRGVELCCSNILDNLRNNQLNKTISFPRTTAISPGLHEKLTEKLYSVQ